MDLRHLAPDFAVTPQIDPADLAEAAKLGFRVVIDNRPDEEVEAPLQGAAIAEAAAAAGMSYHYLPYYPGALTQDLVSAFEALMDQIEGPVLAYCRSGTRSSHLWALWQAGKRPIEEIVAAAAEAGYDHSGLVPLLRMQAENR